MLGPGQAAPTWRAAVDEERQPRGQAEAGQEGHGSWGERGHVSKWLSEPGGRGAPASTLGPVQQEARTEPDLERSSP